VARFCLLLRVVYADFGFPDFAVGFSTRPAVRAGSDAVWDAAEAALAAAATAAGLDYRQQPGEGAFYGPKLEFILKDRQGRDWQCGTVQLDFVLPERLEARYVDPRGRRQVPVMIHHAVLGSLERFIAMLLEHHQGRLPLWLAPEQVVVAPVGQKQAEYADRVVGAFGGPLRTVLDDRHERLSRKIVDARENGIPVFATVGAREAQDETVSLRYADGLQMVLPLAAAVERLRSEARA
jgi:threonyl-tRNA synthetase